MTLLRSWNVLCWNVRGLNSDKKHLALSNAIMTSGCSIVCLQETKKQVIDLAFVKSCCPKRFDKFAYVPSHGASGGILTIWNSSIFTGDVILTEDFALAIRFTSAHSAQTWTLYNIYGPCSGEECIRYTEWLYNFHIQPDEDCLLVGDFNYIRSPDNRNKPGGDINDMSTFNDIIQTQNLIELPVKGRAYTWSNMQQDPLLEQLDWFFTSLHWTHVYPNTLVKPLSKPVLDHTPCVVTIETRIPRAKLFRFESYWILHPGFMDVVKKVWATPTRSGNAATVLCRKFKLLRQELKIWSKNISRLTIAIENSNIALADLDELENLRSLTIPEANFRSILKAHLLRLLDYQRQYWKKRCTIRWVKFGDENTKFFSGHCHGKVQEKQHR